MHLELTCEMLRGYGPCPVAKKRKRSGPVRVMGPSFELGVIGSVILKGESLLREEEVDLDASG